MAVFYVFYVTGCLSRTVAMLLMVLGACGFPTRSSPAWLVRCMAPLIFILIGCSAFILSAYIAEFIYVVGSGNKFERFTFYATRFESWLYWFEILAALLPQLFWFRSVRWRRGVIILVALGFLAPRICEQTVMLITELARPA